MQVGYNDPRIGSVIQLTQNPIVTKPAPQQSVGQTPTNANPPNTDNTSGAPAINANNLVAQTNAPTANSPAATLQSAIQAAQQGGALPQGAGSVQAMLSALGVLNSQSADTPGNTAPTSAPAPTDTGTGAPGSTDQGTTPQQFVSQPTGQDNQWADPSLASPLAALSHYLSGVSAIGLNGDGTSGGAEGGNGQGPAGELYSTSGYDQNTSNYDSANQSLQAALASAQKFDPNAHLEYYDPTSGSEGGGSTPMVRISMDQSLLPKAPTLPGGVQLLSNVRTANNQTPDAGQGPHLYDQNAVYNDPNWGPYTYTRNVNQNYGQNPYTDVGFWGPLLTSAVVGGAGMGAFSGFGGMSNAAAQGIVSGATGSGLAPGTASILGMTGSKIPTTFLGVGRGITEGNYSPAISSLLQIAGGLTGIPGAGTIASLGVNAANGGGINPLAILGLIRQLGIGGPNG